MTPETFREWAADTVKGVSLSQQLRAHALEQLGDDGRAFNDELAEHDAEAAALLKQAGAASDKMNEAMSALVGHLKRTHGIPEPEPVDLSGSRVQRVVSKPSAYV